MHFALMIAGLTSIVKVASAGVFQLPISRTSIGWDLRWGGMEENTEAQQIPVKSYGQLSRRVLRFREHAKFQHHRKNLKRSYIHGEILPSTGPRSDDGVMFWSLFTTSISLGNPPLDLTALIDTSWSSFFVPSANCTLNKRERDHCIVHEPLYNSTQSSTYHADLRPSKMMYHGYNGIYTWGRLSQDTLHISNMEIQGQTFEEVLEWHPMWLTRDDYFDTALGLSLNQTLDSWGNISASSPFQNMVRQRLLDENVFALNIPRTDNETGQLVLGGVPTTLNRSEMLEVPLNHSRDGGGDEWWDFATSSGWQILTQRISIDLPNGSVPILQAEHTAIVSSSYPYIGLPDAAAKIANHAIGLEELYDWVDCDMRPRLPNITFALGPEGLNYTLTPWDYLLEVYDDLFEVLKCMSTFQSMDWRGEMRFIMLGAPFLSGWSVWDRDRASISFSNRG